MNQEKMLINIVKNDIQYDAYLQIFNPDYKIIFKYFDTIDLKRFVSRWFDDIYDLRTKHIEENYRDKNNIGTITLDKMLAYNHELDNSDGMINKYHETLLHNIYLFEAPQRFRMWGDFSTIISNSYYRPNGSNKVIFIPVNGSFLIMPTCMD